MNGIEQSARGVLAVFGRVGGHCVFLSNAIHPRRNFRGLFFVSLFFSLFSRRLFWRTGPRCISLWSSSAHVSCSWEGVKNEW